MGFRRTRDVFILEGVGEEIAIVPRHSVLYMGSEKRAEEWLRLQIEQSRSSKFDVENFADFHVSSHERGLDAAIEGIARGLARGQLVAVRLRKPLPELVPPPVVNLADLAGDEPTTQTPRAPEPETAPATTWVELLLVHENGAGYPQVPVTIFLPDGSSQTVNLDAGSRCRVDGIPERGTCRVELPRDLGPEQQVPGDRPIEVTDDDLLVTPHPDEPVALRSTTLNRIVVGRPRLHVLETEEVSFGLERAVMLPLNRDPDAHDPLEPVPSGLDIVAGALRFAKQHPDKILLLAGHTDRTGSASFNLSLARERATNVYLYLVGDHAQWASHSHQHAEDEDVQRVLTWLSFSQPGFECDPGPIDGDFGPKSQAALEQFRAAYQRQTEEALPDGPPGSDDWKAFANLYDAALTQLTGLTTDQLRTCRENLTFVDPPIVGFGEAYARQPTAAKHALLAEDRRVDVLFFDPREVPKASGESLGEMLYGQAPAYHHDPLAATPRIANEWISIEVVDEEGHPFADTMVELETSDGRRLEVQLDDNGSTKFEDLFPGLCKVSFSDLTLPTDAAPTA